MHYVHISFIHRHNEAVYDIHRHKEVVYDVNRHKEAVHDIHIAIKRLCIVPRVQFGGTCSCFQHLQWLQCYMHQCYSKDVKISIRGVVLFFFYQRPVSCVFY